MLSRMLFRALSVPVILLAVPVLGYLAICVMLFLRQDKMIFFPTVYGDGEFDAHARAAGFEGWQAKDGSFLGWKKLRPDATHSVLAFHGNAGSAVDRFHLGPILSGEEPVNVFLLEYPGYGSRIGVPSERLLTEAAVDGIDTLSEDPALPIWLFGESLGTGVAAAAAGARPERVAGVVLVTPFDSLVGAARFHYPWLPVGVLMRHRFDSVRNLQTYKGPVVIVIAGQDFTTPPVLGERLAERVPSAVRVWRVDDAGHNDSHLLLEDWNGMAGWLRENETATRASKSL